MPKDLGGFAIAALGAIVGGALFRIGWEIGGRLWAMM